MTLTKFVEMSDTFFFYFFFPFSFHIFFQILLSTTVLTPSLTWTIIGIANFVNSICFITI